MAKLMLVPLQALLALLLFALTNAKVLQDRQTRQCTKGKFSSLTLPSGVSISIEQAVSVANNGTFGEGSADKGFPSNATGLPKLCAVIVSVTNTSATPQSKYRFGIFLPDTWNSKILTVGSYSFAGGINWPLMGEGPHYQLATLSTDNGHNSIQTDLSWATPATLYDWGYRAIHGSVQIGKLVTAAYYGQTIARSYYSGCSTAGRQGLKEIQISPDSFDGALIGAPAWDTKFLMPWIAKMAWDVLQYSGDQQFGATQMTYLQAQVLAQCDGMDGHLDNIVSWPEQCNLNFTQLLCSASNPSPDCLNQNQITVANQIYNNYVTSDGTFIHNGFELSSESTWSSLLSGSALTGFDADYIRYWLYNNTSWNITQYTDQVALDSIRINPGQATADSFNINSFKARGGKIMMYHGLSDGTVPTKSSSYYYNQTAKALGVSSIGGLNDFFRYFQVPGMLHCFGSDTNVNAPWMFAGGGQASFLQQYYGFGTGYSVPGLQGNSNYDALLQLMNWVENGTAISQVVATAWDSAGAVTRQRPICPWPQKATYVTGNINLATSWKCA
ncbi:putative feruloyl esterase B-1 [Lachnellula suecica]|uniref:Carboxylic ester hydrolase n=1 Tax=Lachnellula suecica TaxID=602035 RepID=A0A8T9CG96_9HELO|nr:putative feruloyl esterase B-1 [Lachnellula suecica]